MVLPDHMTTVIDDTIRASGHKLGSPVGASALAEKVVDALCDSGYVSEEMAVPAIHELAGEIRMENPAGALGSWGLAERLAISTNWILGNLTEENPHA